MGIAIDQITKYWASNTLEFSKAIIVIPQAFILHLVHNYGAAYGILQNQRPLLIGVACTVIAACILFYKRIATTQWSYYGISFLLMGAIGNLIDRLRLGYVVDFIDIRIFPVFNIADILIDIGVICFIIDTFKTPHETPSN